MASRRLQVTSAGRVLDPGARAAVLVLGARAPVALDCARAFRTAGHRVHLADSCPAFAARWSRLRAPVHRLPPPRTQFARFRAGLRDLVEREGISLMVPTCEEVFYVSEAARRDGYADRVFAPPPEALRRLHSKHDFAILARSLGFAAPETARIETEDALRGLPLSDLVLKPEFSRFATRTLVRPTGREVESLRPTRQHPFVAQRFVAGEEFAIWSAARDGRLTAFAAYRPLRRHGAGAAYGFEAVDLPGADALAGAVAEALSVTGHLSFDVIREPNGTLAPIECNPRAVSGLHLFDAASDLARAFTDEPGAGPLRPPAGWRRHLAPAMALLGLPAALGRGEADAFLREWRTGKDAIGRGRDVGATAGTLTDAACFAWKGVRHGVSATAATTLDIEWNGEEIA